MKRQAIEQEEFNLPEKESASANSQDRPVEQESYSAEETESTQDILIEQKEAALQLIRIGFKKRYFAFLIDHTLGWILGFPFAFIFMDTFVDRIQPFVKARVGAEGVELVSGIIELYALFTGILVGINVVGILFAVTEGAFGLTPGKWFMRLRICQADGCPPDWATLVLRSLVKNGPLMLSFLYFLTQNASLAWLANTAGVIITLGMLLILTSKRQGLHDMIAETMIISLKSDSEESGSIPEKEMYKE